MLARLLLMFLVLFKCQFSHGVSVSKDIEVMRKLYLNQTNNFDKLAEIFGNLTHFEATTPASLMKAKAFLDNIGTTVVQETTKYPKYIPVMNPGSRYTFT